MSFCGVTCRVRSRQGKSCPALALGRPGRFTHTHICLFICTCMHTLLSGRQQNTSLKWSEYKHGISTGTKIALALVGGGLASGGQSALVAAWCTPVYPPSICLWAVMQCTPLAGKWQQVTRWQYDSLFASSGSCQASSVRETWTSTEDWEFRRR